MRGVQALAIFVGLCAGVAAIVRLVAADQLGHGATRDQVWESSGLAVVFGVGFAVATALGWYWAARRP